MIRPDCATRKAGAPSVGLLSVPYSTLTGADPPRRVPLARGAAHSGQPFRRFVTNRCEKCGLALLTRTYGLESTLLSVSFHKYDDVHTQAAVQGTMR